MIQRKRIQFFTWETREGKTRRFSVEHARELIRQLGLSPECNVTLEMAQEGLRRNYRQHELEPKHIAKADFNEPLIFITLWDELENGWRQILIDGWHRAKKMVLMGRTDPLKAYILSPSESLCVEIGETFYEQATTILEPQPA